MAAIVVDGMLDEPEWQQADISCTDWRRTIPFALDTPRYRSELRISATADGLAAAFIIDQPADRRTKPLTPRDAETQDGDLVSLLIDFDGGGQVGYEFAVGLGGGVRDGRITNQIEFDRDWDGVWQHQVRELPDQWFVEILIPWSSVSLRPTGQHQRSIGIYASRFLFDHKEVYACPGISSERSVFLSDFTPVRIPEYVASGGFEFIPYSTSVVDLLHDRTDLKSGADFRWKPSPRVQMAAAINPDFGQVESDELVVNFSAIETVFTDKRPFFTEDQAIFEMAAPDSGRIIYTRRIGGPTDDGSAGSSDIDAAAKVTGSVGPINYGAFIAQEADHADDVGRLFAATRVTVPLKTLRIGHVATSTDRPQIDRRALVNAVDFDFTPNDWWRAAGQIIRSDIDVVAERSAGYEAWMQVDLARSSAVSHAFALLSIDDDFDMNDAGFLERNSLRQIEWQTERRLAYTDAGSRLSGQTQRLYLNYQENMDGQRLEPRAKLSREVQYTSAWRSYQELRYSLDGADDLISRGNGIVRLDQRFGAYFEIDPPRMENWTYGLVGDIFQQGVENYSVFLQLGAKWNPYQALTLGVTNSLQWSDDWLLAEEGNLFGIYSERRLSLDFSVDWIPMPRQEVRLRWQWIGVQAAPQRALRSDQNGDLRPSADPLVPFTVGNLGFQLRYRYQMAPKSELFLVYSRGGFELNRGDERGAGRLLTEMFDVRNADQLLLKVSYQVSPR